MKLDHVVVHIDNDEKILTDLKVKLQKIGIPFEPGWGKGTKGFKASNIWIGRQYFEIIRLLKPDGGGWESRWVEAYNKGQRGAFCLFLVTENIQETARQLQEKGVVIDGPKRLSFKALFGLFKKVLPWELIYLPPIPGTHLEIAFIQYDPDPQDKMKQYLVPNSDENGIVGINSAEISLPLNEEVVRFLELLFPEQQATHDGIRIRLDNGALQFSNGESVQINLRAEVTSPKNKGQNFSLENVSLFT